MRGLKILIQSFFIGVMRCGGIGIRLVSDFRADCVADAGKAGKAGAELASRAGVGSISIIRSSSSAVLFEFKGGITPEDISSSPSICVVLAAVRAFFLFMLRRFLVADVFCSTCATTMSANDGLGK